MNGQKIIQGLREAIAGDFAAVTIEGQRWVRDERGLRDALEPFAALGVSKTVRETPGMHQYNVPFYDCPEDLVLYHDRMGNVITVGDVRRAASALTKGEHR